MELLRRSCGDAKKMLAGRAATTCYQIFFWYHLDVLDARSSSGCGIVIVGVMRVDQCRTSCRSTDGRRPDRRGDSGSRPKHCQECKNYSATLMAAQHDDIGNRI